MKRMALIVTLIVICLSIHVIAEATVDGWVTGDNQVWIWGYDGSGDWGGTSWLKKSADNWWIADYIFGYPNIGQTVDIYIAVENIQVITPGTDRRYPPGEFNPGGFLASITSSSGVFDETGTNKLLTDTAHWEIVAHAGWAGDPVFDPTGLSGWVPPTAYGANDSPTLWNESIGYNPVSNIDENAQWIWTDNNFNPNMDNYAILHTSITVTPEPATMVLVGIGGLTIAVLKRKRKA